MLYLQFACFIYTKFSNVTNFSDEISKIGNIPMQYRDWGKWLYYYEKTEIRARNSRMLFSSLYTVILRAGLNVHGLLVQVTIY